MPPTDEIRLAKEELRRELHARRAALSEEARADAAGRVAAKVLRLPQVAAAGRLFVCLSFGDELDTGPIVESLLASGREVFIPRAERSPTRLAVCRFPCRLVTLNFGLRQPAKEVPELPPGEVDATIGAALVAGLGFDRRGFRLGYGSGYFDRFLAGLTIPALGLAFACQIVEKLPTEPHDVPMTAVLTESDKIEAAAGR